MFNIQNKYTEHGCYRFLDNEAKTIYIGVSKNVHTRLFSQHFKKGFGHLDNECYESTCKIEIIKCKDYAQALSLEQYLIDKYVPRWNKKDKRKDIFNSINFDNIDYYKKLERWNLYYTFREYDKHKIQTNRKQNILALASTFIFFIMLISYMLKGFL